VRSQTETLPQRRSHPGQASATQNIELICDQIVQSGKLASPECLRIALIGYRCVQPALEAQADDVDSDHPPQGEPVSL
jgi:hypothetical protein